MANQHGNEQFAQIYRIFLLYIEPFMTLVGALAAFFTPELYLRLTHTPTAPKYGIPTSTRIVLNQLANLYFCFSLNEAFVLRASTDLKVWRAVLIALLIADFGHIYSVSPLGVDIYWKASSWNAIDWGNLGFVYVGALTRICFLYSPYRWPLTIKGWSSKPTTPPRRSTRRIKATPKAKA